MIKKNVTRFWTICMISICSNLIYAQSLEDGNIIIKKNKSQATITEQNVNDYGYFIYNNPVPHNRKLETRLKIKVDGQLLKYGGADILIHPKSNVYIEGDRSGKTYF